MSPSTRSPSPRREADLLATMLPALLLVALIIYTAWCAWWI